MIIGFVVVWFGERWVFMFGMIVDGIGYILFVFVIWGWMVFLIMVLFVLGGIGMLVL